MSSLQNPLTTDLRSGEGVHGFSPPEGLGRGEGLPVGGDFVNFEGRRFYRIANFDSLQPFLMTVVSSNDQWMYVSSRGGLSAGRVSAENCLFPYESVDKLHYCHSYTGPLTLIRVADRSSNGRPSPPDSWRRWQPFSYPMFEDRACVRNLYKHEVGNQVIFEEAHQELGLTFRYGWQMSQQFGFVRTVTLENTGTELREIDLLDGLQNLQPYGIGLSLYQNASCLTDAYKQGQFDSATKLGVYSLTSQILDHATAAESLKASTVACIGLDEYAVLLSSKQLQDFCAGENTAIQTERMATGVRSHYLACAEFSLAPGDSKTWHFIADVARDHLQIAQLRNALSKESTIGCELQDSLEHEHLSLVRNVASSDGLQTTGNRTDSVHHFANVLFNNMRGGALAANYQLETADFSDFVAVRNKGAFQSAEPFLTALPATVGYGQLLEQIAGQGSRDLLRLGLEYLPLTFGRRHGDPSRPWNQFNIHVFHADGSRNYHYEGNWRDIFQNWEALAQSFPVFLPSMIAKFVNTSTVDGYNPYRVFRDGFDWEAPEPDDPWANIGYWGDHQIVYLLKLLEATQNHFPGLLGDQLESEQYVYADVPYRIAAYDKLVEDSRATIDYDLAHAKVIEQRVQAQGEDGKLLQTADGEVCYVTLAEKLLVPVLTKISNLVLGGGIWMNTQRPEWNDANNALVGPGLSVVTACYLRRYLEHLKGLLAGLAGPSTKLSAEVAEWLGSLATVLSQSRSLLGKPSVSDLERRQLLDALGQAFSDYRLQVYEHGISGKVTIEVSQIQTLLKDATDLLDATIRENQRSDGLYHAYNLLELKDAPSEASVAPLYEMLEGQVAALSTGIVGPEEAVQIVEKMFDSPLYRADQHSFLLYPERELPGFLSRNVLPAESVQGIKLLREQLQDNASALVVRSDRGEYHFENTLDSVTSVTDRLASLAAESRWAPLVEQDRAAVLDLFDEVFQHSKYTGRSGAMYGYEGLGSIYWHMVAKLLLAVQEVYFRAVEEGSQPGTIQSLAEAYYRVRRGLSSEKTPQEYGAFPTDPYSHTPKHSGAQQPGMTGQVKEEILTRRGELGVRVRDGRICIEPCLLRKSEFVDQQVDFHYYDVQGKSQSIAMPPQSLAFTICQVPVIYRVVQEGTQVDIRTFEGGFEGAQVVASGGCLDREASKKVFYRTGEISKIEVRVPLELVLCHS